ncbi:MAG: aspartate/glutamate racemase family protein [Deltaproteobacteria bacterium]|nr:aspartate/glutamate racemase family protein [Deltaproteobacteria bacterium]MBW2040857.1 aspartate/glutamate racemase family protein [Deltaproteobacteria bacterium]MBW2132067.1 aspartate/glutamate racemase family protein [Deltaproteobacteria bacterium]
MIYTARKGQTSSGEAIGILLLETSVPFIPGDVANATTYPFPVRFQKVEGFTVARAIGKDPSVLEAMIEAAEDLVAQGVRAVTGDCGFMAIHQNVLAEKIRIPVFLSSLLQIPFITGLFTDTGKVGIITADAGSLDSRLLKSIGIENPEKLVIVGLENQPHFYDFAIKETGVLDTDKVEKEVVAAARHLTTRNPDIRALLLECSLLPPYAAAVQEAVDLPVFDYITMIRFVFSAVVQKRYSGFI